MGFEELLKQAEAGNTEAMLAVARCYDWGEGAKWDRAKAFLWYQRILETNPDNAIVLNRVGEYYYFGYATKISYKKAIRLFEKAAEQNFAAAQRNLGRCYWYGRGVKKNHDKANEWYKKAAEQNFAAAQYDLATFFDSYGFDSEMDAFKMIEFYKKAALQGYGFTAHYLDNEGEPLLDWTAGVAGLERAAEDGSPAAMVALGLLNIFSELPRKKRTASFREDAESPYHAALIDLDETYGAFNNRNSDTIYITPARDPRKGLDYIARAAAQGFPFATALMGGFYDSGKIVPRDSQRALRFYLATAVQGDIRGMLKASTHYYENEENYFKGHDWLSKAIKMGSGEALEWLAIRLDSLGSDANGFVVQKKYFETNMEKALGGDAEAQYTIAQLYAGKMGTELSIAEACKWLQKAADNGHEEAALFLADYLFDGSCPYFPADLEKAVAYYKQAAEAGEFDAQLALFACYANGTGVEQNADEAYKWYKKARAQQW